MEERAIMEKGELLPFEEHIETFKAGFEKLVKNRSVLCDEQGVLREGNDKYRKKYIELVNSVIRQGMTVVADSIRYFYIPETDLGKSCAEEIQEIATVYMPEFVSIVKKGSYEQYMDKVEAFKNDCVKVYYDYLLNKGMHKFLYE